MSHYRNSRKLTTDWGREIRLHSEILCIERVKTDLPGIYYREQYLKEEPLRQFPTGSTYEGHYNSIGFTGLGKYTFPHGAVYEGYFENGRFEGHGSITYPKGHRMDGLWEKGRLKDYTFTYPDGLVYEDDWKYLQMPDRSFQLEINNGMNPAGLEYLTNKQPTKRLKPLCFDTEDGYFDSKKNCVYSDSNEIQRVASKKEQKFIKENYRRCEDVPTGYRPEFYEYWTWGCLDDMRKLEKADIFNEESATKPSVIQDILYVSTIDKL